MIAALRDDFLQRYEPERYAGLLRRVNQRTRTEVSIRIAETPVFLPTALIGEMVSAGAAMTHQLLSMPEYLRLAAASIPEQYRAANEDAHPNFMTVDFGLTAGEDGKLTPTLVELQAFPSVYGYQAVLGEEYRRAFNLDPALSLFLNGHDDRSYWALLRRVIVADHDPENVILMEVTPEQQKTLPDFHIHEDRLGIRTVDITAIRQQGRQLFYDRDGHQTRIERIYNRAIVEEITHKKIALQFDFRGDLDVEWAGHPNWYFQLSKLALPFLRHPSVPPAVLLSDWMRGGGRDRLADDPAKLVLKPLFSFAGKGVEFGPTKERLQAIPPAERPAYLLQQRVAFEPTVRTPAGPTQAEIRILYLWPQGGDLQAVNTLVRLGRGAMMGVDHNRGQAWVGGSAGMIA